MNPTGLKQTELQKTFRANVPPPVCAKCEKPTLKQPTHSISRQKPVANTPANCSTTCHPSGPTLTNLDRASKKNQDQRPHGTKFQEQSNPFQHRLPANFTQPITGLLEQRI